MGNRTAAVGELVGIKPNNTGIKTQFCQVGVLRSSSFYRQMIIPISFCFCRIIFVRP